MKNTIFVNALFAATVLFTASCKDDAPDIDRTVEPVISAFRVVSAVEATGTINNTDHTIVVDIPADQNLTTAEVVVEVPTGATVSPASGATVNFTNPVNFTVTGSDAAGNPVTQVYVVSVNRIATVAFAGRAATIAGLEDDAKAAATWMQTKYGADFVYLPASAINANALRNVKVLVYYEMEISPTINLGPMATEAVANAVSNYVRDGGQLLLAGDATQYIFNINRLPASLAFNESNPAIGLEENKPADDFWGLSVVPTTTSADRTSHPLFAGVLNAENRVLLNNAPTREVRLVWWNVGPAGGECCGNVDMVTNFEQQAKATKLGSLRHVGDYFGFAAMEFGRTDLNTHASLNAQIPKDFKGNVLMLSNTIIGYEWNINDGSPNEYHNNIVRLTENAISYLRGVYDAL